MTFDSANLMAPRTKVYVGMGSNLEQPVRQLQRALIALNDIPNAALTRVSSFYETEPVGIKAQPNFVNAVVEMETTLTPQQFLAELLAIEVEHHRIRAEKNGPRTLDLDLLIYGDRQIEEPDLVAPHPRMHERAFVLVPLNEIAPHLHIPGRGFVKDWLVLTETLGVTRIDEELASAPAPVGTNNKHRDKR
jgi:2-amino-4-hydroxy-6-hydroxymethyldihydropteridine diphosphokinase